MAKYSWLGSTLLLLVAAAVFVAAILPDDEEPEAPAPPGFSFRVPSTFVPIERRTVIETIDLVGDVISNRVAEMAFERPGRLASVLVDLGDRVSTEAELAQLDDAVLQKEMEIARALAAALDEEAGLAERDAQRAEEVGSGIESESTVDRLKSMAVAARKRSDRQAAEVGRLQEQLRQGSLKAPFDAVVVARTVTQGSYVGAGQVAFRLIDLQRREVHLEIPPAVAAEIEAGAQLSLRADELPGQEWTAKLDLKLPAADPATRTFRGVVRLQSLDPERRLLPGMFVRATVVRRTVEDAWTVPADAVLESEGSALVVKMVAGDSGEVADFVPVRILARDAERVAVEALSPGAFTEDTRIVVTGADLVFPGANLAAQPHTAGAQAHSAGGASDAGAAGEMPGAESNGADATGSSPADQERG